MDDDFYGYLCRLVLSTIGISWNEGTLEHVDHCMVSQIFYIIANFSRFGAPSAKLLESTILIFISIFLKPLCQ